MTEAFVAHVRFEPNNIQLDEDEFDRFSDAAYAIEEALPELIECGVTADLDEQFLVVECIVAAESEAEANRTVSSIMDAIAHRVDVLAGRASIVSSEPRAERLTPA